MISLLCIFTYIILHFLNIILCFKYISSLFFLTFSNSFIVFIRTIFSCWNNWGKNRQVHYRNKNRLLIIIRCSISTLHLKYISNVLSTKNRMSSIISKCIKIEMSTKYIHFYWLKWFHVLKWHFWIHLVQITSCAKARFAFFVYMTLKKCVCKLLACLGLI